MTPADKRMTELLDRWLTSIELHLKYAALDDASYRQVQPWPAHDRPARWILEAAQQKVLQLKSLCHAHVIQQDGSFAEGLELMCFLANLVGAQNIKRFIPLADPAKEKAVMEPSTPITHAAAATPATTASSASAPVSMPVAPAPPAQAPRSVVTPANATAPPMLEDTADDSRTREMPLAKPVAIQGNDSTREMPRLKMPSRKAEPSHIAAPKRTHGKPATSAKSTSAPVSSLRVQEIVVADAVRLLKWGREWHELADLIARMAERPGASEVRRILKSQRGTIENQLST